jgi:hypothetical protein
MDLTALTPKTSDWTPSRPGRKSTEKTNPFVDNGWLQKSFDEGQSYAVSVPGTRETKTTPNREGETVTREVLTGDAATVVRLLRAASNKLGVGVSIDVTEAKRRGYMDIRYLAQKRKVRKPKDNESE